MAIEAAFYRYNSNNYHDNDYWDLHARAVLSPNPCWMPHYISTFLGMSSHTVRAEPSCRVRVLLAFISLEHCIHTYYMYTGISYHIAPYRLLLLFLMGFSLLCVCVELLVRLFSPFEKRQAWHEAWLPVCLWLDRYGCVSNRNAAHYSYNHNEQRKKHTPFHAGFYFCWVVLFVAAETMAMAAATAIVAWHKACSHFHNKDVWYLVDRNKSPAKHQANKPHTIINTIAFALPLQECLCVCVGAAVSFIFCFSWFSTKFMNIWFGRCCAMIDAKTKNVHGNKSVGNPK